MARNGTLTGEKIKTLWLTFEWERTEVDVENNRSLISWELKLNSSSSLEFSADKTYTLSVNDSPYNGTFSNNITWGNSGGSTTLRSGTTSIKHNSDGSKSFKVDATFNIAVTISGAYVGILSLSGTQILDPIPRATTPTFTPSNDLKTGDTVKITLDRASASFTHDITYAWGKATGAIIKGATTSASWTIPRNFADHVPNGLSSICVIRCSTYNESELVGTTSVSLQIGISDKDVPVINSVDIIEATAGIAEKFGAFIQNHSRVGVTVEASGVYSSTIKKYETKLLNNIYADPIFTSEPLKESGSIGTAVKVTDSRNRTSAITEFIEVLPYAPPSVELFACTRANAQGVDDNKGDYLKASIRFKIEPINNLNDKSYKLEYKEPSSDTWQLITQGSVYSFNGEYVSTEAILNPDNPYEIHLTVSDYFSTVVFAYLVPTAFTLFDFHASGNGLSLGKVAEYENLFDVDLPTRFRKRVTFDDVSGIPQLADTGWLDLPLKTGWSVPYDTDTPKYRKIGSIVYLKGLLNATASAATTIAELPVGYRPVGQYSRFPCTLNQKEFVNVQVGRNGLITDYTKNTSTARSLLCLNGITFLADG